MFKIEVYPYNLLLTASKRELLLDALLRGGVPIDNVCGGKGICGKCKVKILEGKVSPPTERERAWQKILGSNIRLACQARVYSDLKVEISDKRDIKGKILSGGLWVKVKLDPLIKKTSLNIPKPGLANQTADMERILTYSGVRAYDPILVSKVSEVLRKSNFHVSLVIFEDELIDVIPETHTSHVYGVSFDIGTTTVVGYLHDLSDGKLVSVKSAYNEQIKFGEDVISRIEYATKAPGNLAKVRGALINTVNKIIEELCASAGIDPLNIYDIVCSGNTIMLSFLLGSNCRYISQAPYIPPFTSPVRIKARDLGVKANPSGYVRTLPSISGYIGGDVVADIMVSELYRYDEPVALVDIGTNCEVVIKTGDELLAASCAAGPALEGYGIRNGMRAVEGAIESIVITDGEVRFKVIGNRKPVGICGSGIVEAVAWMRLRGIVDKTGRIVEGSSERVIRKNGELSFIIVEKELSGTGRDIVITQSDIRKFQLAKGAVLATFLTLTRLCGIDVRELEKVFIAGAFGNFVDPLYANIVGLLPELPRDRFVYIGNGSGTGASLLLLSKDLWDKAREIAKKVKAIELNLIPYFKEEFINSTLLPHKNEKLFKDTLKLINLMK